MTPEMKDLEDRITTYCIRVANLNYQLDDLRCEIRADKRHIKQLQARLKRLKDKA